MHHNACASLLTSSHGDLDIPKRLPRAAPPQIIGFDFSRSRHHSRHLPGVGVAHHSLVFQIVLSVSRHHAHNSFILVLPHVGLRGAMSRLRLCFFDFSTHARCGVAPSFFFLIRFVAFRLSPTSFCVRRRRAAQHPIFSLRLPMFRYRKIMLRRRHFLFNFSSSCSQLLTLRAPYCARRAPPVYHLPATPLRVLRCGAPLISIFFLVSPRTASLRLRHAASPSSFFFVFFSPAHISPPRLPGLFLC
ncbi:hypothetical protein C8J57DRAFT_192122 [Mycena rebaudengoi]|nr:hypothetical protein C8J57DRAFT_192122 [Mycena rebaudengoi]